MAPGSTKLTGSDSNLKAAFLGIATPSNVAQLLDVPLTTLYFYAYKKQNYASFQLKRACGTPRTIYAPVTPLKIVQRKLSQVLYAAYGTRSPVHGFARNRSIKSNAARHLGAQWILNFDLKDFFPTIHFGRVLGLFKGKPYVLPHDAAVLMAKICCHDGALPIGAPTSPIVANMICAKLDSELKALTWGCGCKYTRYADDITISTRATTFDKKIVSKSTVSGEWEISDEIKSVIKNNDFTINPAKTRVRNRQSSLEITGVRINSGLNVSRKLLRQIRAMLHAWEIHGEAATEQEHRAKFERKQYANGSPAFRDVVRGKIEFAGFIRGRDNRQYVQLLQRFLKLAGARAQPILVGPNTHESVIRQAVWLLMDKKQDFQGTAFAVEGNRLLTAAHNTNQIIFASRPAFDGKTYFADIVERNDELDIAEIRIKADLPVQFALATEERISLMQSVCVAGFPRYFINDSVGFRFGRVVQERYYASIKHKDPNNTIVLVKHFIVDADIVKGNSGGPVLDDKNRVIGVAVKGLDSPGSLGENDELSSFVPITRSSLPSKATQP